MGALDELLSKWRDNPDSGTTLALCTYLGSSQREELIREVGSTAEAWHKEDPQVMLAVGRMYLDAGLLQEAQAALVVAGKLNQAEPGPYRYLGEVLLRRGDAARAEKVLARALQIGAAEADTRMWHDRAVVYVALQSRVGMRAVADEIDRSVPKRTSIPPPTMSAHEADRLAKNARRPEPVARPLPSVPPPPKLVASVPPAIPAPPRVHASYRAEAVSEEEVPTGRFSVDEIAQREARGELSTVLMPDRQPPVGQPAAAPAARAVVPVRGEPSRGTGPAIPNVPKVARAAPPASAAPASGVFDDSPRPRAETVLAHLARVGVYEKGGGAPPAWVAPPRARPRGTWLFVVATVAAVGAGYGGFVYSRHARDQRMASARSIEADVKKRLHSATLADIKKTDDQLSRVFDLDSRSQVAAILWLQNRVLSALTLPAEPRGIESALARCKTLGIDEASTAFGKIASFLAEGDLAGAAAILPKWDEKAKGDAFYQLAAGAMLERAGEMRALARYQQAFELDPDLVLARAFHAELVTLELGVAAARPLVDDVTKRLGDAPVARALAGLLWAMDSGAGELADTARVADADRQGLPTQLLAIPYVVEARVAARAGKTAEALAGLDKALRVAATPAIAASIGQVAIELGDEPLARQATLRALSYSALYPRARALAARVALLGAHLDEARKAIQELDAKSPEVAVVRAAAAYEALDLSELESASAAMGAPEGPARALAAGMGIVMGRKIPAAGALEDMAQPSVPWGDLVAVDAALDSGNLELAQKVVARWGSRSSTPAYALRKARLLRYSGKVEEAVAASADALVAGGVTARVLVERFDCLVAKQDVSGARDLLGQYPAVLGPMTEFLKVQADVAGGKLARAKATLARLEPPPEDSPLMYELIAARALVAVGDRRAKPLVGTLFHSLPKHPELVELAKAVGLVR